MLTVKMVQLTRYTIAIILFANRAYLVGRDLSVNRQQEVDARA